MKLLLDTHALLWWLGDDRRLGVHARDLLADPGHDVLVSVVSLWEIVVKQRVGKLAADIDKIADAIAPGGFVLLDIRLLHLRTLAALPAHHRDPFDHLLIAQAIGEAAVFLSADPRAASYPVEVLDCSAPVRRRT